MEVYTRDYEFKEKSIKRAVECMVDAAFEQLYSHGIKDDKAFWMIYKWHIDIMDAYYTHDFDKIRVYTTPTGVNRFFSYRQFIVKADDAELIKATCEIIYVDKERMKPVRADEFSGSFKKLFEEQNLDFDEYHGFDNLLDFTIEDSHIDSYHHVNNAVYIDKIIDIYNKEIRSIKLKYTKQCLLGENVKIAYMSHDDAAEFRFFTESEAKVYASVSYRR